MIRYLGSCKTCKKANRPSGLRAEIEVKTVRTETPTRTLSGAEGFPIVRHRYFVNGVRTPDVNHHYIACPSCGSSVCLSAVRGVKSEKKCGARCLSSTGPVCECSCAGQNHGGGSQVCA